jgi:hypothetical protein
MVGRRRGHQLARKVWAETDEVVSASIIYVETRAALAAVAEAVTGRAPELGRLGPIPRPWLPRPRRPILVPPAPCPLSKKTFHLIRPDRSPAVPGISLMAAIRRQEGPLARWSRGLLLKTRSGR